MRSAVLIADGKVVGGPAPKAEMEADYKAFVAAGWNGASVIELWSEDRGRERKHKFAPVPAAEKQSKKKG